ncbi:ENT3-4, partial [Cucurbita argyrosperma subsp. argyrosperma]
MEHSYFHELKKKACFFLKEHLKIARLALTDVTHAQLLTEEATSGNPWPPDSPSMREITKASFEVDEFYRIVEILHKRLERFEAREWRASYNAVILVEHALTHGPYSFAKEFANDRAVLREMEGFHFVDDKGVRKLSARVLKLLEEEDFLIQERIKARNLTRGIQGFGSFSHESHFDRFNRKQHEYEYNGTRNLSLIETRQGSGDWKGVGKWEEAADWEEVSQSLISSVL